MQLLSSAACLLGAGRASRIGLAACSTCSGVPSCAMRLNETAGPSSSNRRTVLLSVVFLVLFRYLAAHTSSFFSKGNNFNRLHHIRRRFVLVKDDNINIEMIKMKYEFIALVGTVG